MAGIIGARWSNASGDGTVGVVPGMPIYAFKALDAAGVGTISNVLRALADILNLLKQGRKIAAVNLSIAVSTKDREPPSREELNFICSYIEGISAYGTAVVAAAGEMVQQQAPSSMHHCCTKYFTADLPRLTLPSCFKNGHIASTIIAGNWAFCRQNGKCFTCNSGLRSTQTSQVAASLNILQCVLPHSPFCFLQVTKP